MPDKIALITWTFELVTGTIKRIVIYTRTEGEGEEKVLQFAFAHAIERKKEFFLPSAKTKAGRNKVTGRSNKTVTINWSV